MKQIAILVLAVLAWLPAGSAEAVVARARDSVKATLKKEGIRLGVNSREKSYVFVGYHAEETKPQQLGTVLRGRFFLLAALNAKRDLMRARHQTISSKDEVTMVDDGVRQEIFTKSFCKYLAEVEMHGSTVLASAESFDSARNVYEVAVAVKWSAALEEEGVRLASKGLPLADSVEDDSEWKAELSKYELPTLVGCRRFVDRQGNIRFFAVGTRECDGGSALNDRKAIRIAQMQALRNLASGLRTDAALHESAVTVLRMMSSGEISEVQAWEELVSRVRESNNLIVRGHEVDSYADAVDPLTGKRVYVSVYGVVLPRKQKPNDGCF